jgi:hypothetical protein
MRHCGRGGGRGGGIEEERGGGGRGEEGRGISLQEGISPGEPSERIFFSLNLLVKNRKTNFLRQAIQEPIFLWLMQILKAVVMGVVAACGIFWVR